MTPIVSAASMRAIDAASPVAVEALIQRAGAAVARAAITMLGGSYGRTVAVLVGPGNNGADGRVAAALLRQRGVVVREYDALDAPTVLPTCDLVIDAAFGTGFRGTWQAPAVGRAAVLAVDVPSGLDADTGVAPTWLLPADVTVTFAAAKPGHFLADGPDVVGALQVVDIGLDVPTPEAMRVDALDVGSWWPRRPRSAHKWSAAVRVIAGSPGMHGAAALASRAAMRSGSGMVVLSSPGAEAGLNPLLVEPVQRSLRDADWAPDVLSDLDRFHSLLIGPGLGRSETTVAGVVATINGADVPVVVDGDGLFALTWNEAGTLDWLRERHADTVLTPHDGEFALLTGGRPSADRLASTRGLADSSGCVVLLKGWPTIVAEPDGAAWFVVDGDQRLATAGTGDVLAGMIAALLASGVAAGPAAAAAAWVHAKAAEQAMNPGMIASDLIESLPIVVASLLADLTT